MPDRVTYNGIGATVAVDLSHYHRRINGDTTPRTLPDGCLACGLSLVSCHSFGRCCGECRGHGMEGVR